MTDRWRQALDAVRQDRDREEAAQSEARQAKFEHESWIATETEKFLRPLAEQLEIVHAALDRAGWPKASVRRDSFYSYRMLPRTLFAQRTVTVLVRELGRRKLAEPEAGLPVSSYYQCIEFTKRPSVYQDELIHVGCAGAIVYRGPLKGPVSIGRVLFREIPPVELTPDLLLRAVAAWAVESGVALDL